MQTVLVVDDDRSTRELIRVVLEEGGFRAETAATGVDAIDNAGQRRPALVVLDVMLPKMDGFAVADVLRARHGPDLPILLVTGNPGAAAMRRRAGAYRCVGKPFDLDELLDAVREGLGVAAPVLASA